MNLYDAIVTNIETVMTVYSQKGRRLSMNCRKNYGLSFCIYGKIEYVKDGIKTVSDETCAVILPKGASYELYGTETGEFPLVNFSTAETLTDDFIVIPLGNPKTYLSDFERMKALWRETGERAKAISIFYDLLDRLSKESSKIRPIILPALAYVSENLSNPALSNADMAHAANISEIYLRKLFVSELGMSPKQYVLDMRLRHAKLLLSENNLSVGDISEKCGFASVYHFCRAFKGATGSTPTEYAKSTSHISG